MRWLITIKEQSDLKQLDQDLSSIGCKRISDEPPIPLSHGEQVIEVEAAENFHQRFKQGDYSENLRSLKTEIKQINPSSNMNLY